MVRVIILDSNYNTVEGFYNFVHIVHKFVKAEGDYVINTHLMLKVILQVKI